MREIKFRVWNSNVNYMYSHGWLMSANVVYSSMSNPEKYNHVMQYTGLKDKNGEEIYEGDIVRILYTDWPSKGCNDERTIGQYMNDIATIGFVAWDDYSTGWVVRVKSKYSYDEDDRVNSSIVHGRHGFREVIGNIYQNPELLS